MSEHVNKMIMITGFVCPVCDSVHRSHEDAGECCKPLQISEIDVFECCNCGNLDVNPKTISECCDYEGIANE